MLSVDFSILSGIQNIFKCNFWDTVMPYITALGNQGFIWILIGLLLTLSQKYRKYGIILLISLLVGLVIGNFILKPIVARERPFSFLTDMVLLIKQPSDFSFPSGHTTSSFIAATVLLHTKKSWGYGALVLASLIAFSRLYLYVHFPSDILCGILLGIVIGQLMFRFSNKRF